MQSKKMSLVETCVSTAIGYAVSLVTWMACSAYFGIEQSFAQQNLIAMIFMAVSIARGYLVRRAFNAYHLTRYVKHG